MKEYIKNKRGISLIVLIITIIVVIILAAVVILTLSKNNPMSSAKEATFKSDIRSFQEELSMYRANQILEGKDTDINTDDYPDIDTMKAYISNFSSKYMNKIGIENGELVYYKSDIKTVDNQVTDIEEEWLKSLGIKKKGLTQTDEADFTWGSDDPNNEEYGIIKKYNGSASDVVIPERCTKIDSSAFYNNSNLKNIILTSNVNDVPGSFVILCSKLLSIKVVEDNNSFTSVDGVLYSEDKSKLIRYPEGKESEEYVISEDTRYLGERAFQDCNNLKKITISNKISSVIDYNYNCSAFNSCKNLIDIYVSEKNQSFTSIDGVIFTKNKTEIVRFPTGRSGNYEIPTNVTAVLDNAFENCTNLENVTIPESVTYINSKAFYCCGSLKEITIPSNVKSIGFETFDSCINLSKVTLSEGLTAINWKSFRACTSLNNINFPSTLTKIGEDAFNQCKSLKNIILPENLEVIAKGAFCGVPCNNVIIPLSVTSIGGLAFYNFDTSNSLSIRCRVSIKPEGWNSSWCGANPNSSINIIWGYTGE